jgi:hypothetical protein
MTRHTLPILVPGRSSPIDVPCALPESFDLAVFLPIRGIRTFTCWLTSTDPLTAEVKDVQLNNREGDPRAGLNYDVDDDEQRRADEAAGDVLGQVLASLGLMPGSRAPVPVPVEVAPVAGPLHAIALAWHAEQHAVEMGSRLANLFSKRNNGTTAAEDIYKRVPDLTSSRGQDASVACEGLRCYVQEALDAAVIAQGEKAERQLAEHPPARSDEEDGSERIRAPRSLDAATLKCLDVEY